MHLEGLDKEERVNGKHFYGLMGGARPRKGEWIITTVL
jgi:hypothetical protein